jgi:trehalose synthase
VAELPLPARQLHLLASELTPAASERLLRARDRAREQLGGRTIWNVNSTERGGGVAELMRAMLPYCRGSGIDVRWLVIEATPAFFRLTKRIHNMLHGSAGGRLGRHERTFFERVARTVSAQALRRVARDDVVVLHDPQTAGLVPLLKRAGATVVWRCHVGSDNLSESTDEAWRFLLPYVAEADTCVFTRAAFVPAGVEPARVRVFPPAIDPRSPKNQALDDDAARAVLAHCGLVDGRAGAVRVDLDWGDSLEVRRRCRVLRAGAPPQLGRDRLVVALGRWDRLKDPIGVMRGFVDHVRDPRARLIVAGPASRAVADDPEALRFLREVRAAWEALPEAGRRGVDVAILPLVDVDENALIVNALQRKAAVVVKKSLEEGFGLGVTEALWKARPVVATRVGGHRDQIEHRRTGLLVDDPRDLAAFAAAVDEALASPAEALDMGLAGREAVRDRFLADRDFEHWLDTLASVSAGRS